MYKTYSQTLKACSVNFTLVIYKIIINQSVLNNTNNFPALLKKLSWLIGFYTFGFGST